MGWPKGMKRSGTNSEPTSPRAGVLKDIIGRLDHVQSSSPAELFFPEQNREFEGGTWYKSKAEQPIKLDPTGRVLKWSVIRFEVVKIAFGVVAVRFEDGSFEAIQDPDFSKFDMVDAPRY